MARGNKLCNRCGLAPKVGKVAFCGPCRNESYREYRQTPVGKRNVRAMNLRKYGLTPKQYEAMVEVQNGVCASCGLPETKKNQFGPLRLAVDHDHDTGLVRGLLCMNCNRALGLLGDSLDRLERLMEYRRSHG